MKPYVDVAEHIEITSRGQTTPIDGTLQTWFAPWKGMVKSVFSTDGVDGTAELTALVIP
jgi:hypothetical protein